MYLHNFIQVFTQLYNTMKTIFYVSKSSDAVINAIIYKLFCNI